MGIKLNAIGVLNGDRTNPNTRHKYFPDVSFPTQKGPLKNHDIPVNERVFVICDYLTVGHRSDYAMIDANGNSHIEFAQMFEGQVSEIHHLDHPIDDREITVSELLNVFGGEGSSVAQNLITDVAVHLMKGSSLEDEEQKN